MRVPYRAHDRNAAQEATEPPEPAPAADRIPLISTKGLNVSFQNIRALTDIDLEVYPGEVLCLLGDNGAGKSTLVETIMGYQPYYEGEIFLQGEIINSPSVSSMRSRGIEISYQSPVFNPCMRVWQNFFIGKEITKKCGPFRLLDKRGMKGKTEELFRKCGIDLPFSVTTPVGKLSGGQRRILSILRAYYFGKKLLILDEPTAALSEHEVEIALNMVKKAKSEGTAVLFITHKEHEVFQVADRFFILYQGNQYMIINRKYSFLKRVSSLLISSRVLAVQDIAAEIVYQFSQPLRNMRENVERLLRDYEVINDSELFSELVDTLMTEIHSLTSIIYHLSNFSEEPEISRSEVNVRSLLESVIGEIPLALRSHIHFEIEVKDGLSCFMDRDIIQQVLLNLVNNAVEASEEGGRIVLSAEPMEGRRSGIVLSVKDWGKGMDEAILEEVYNPFFTTKSSNSGLGLSIVYKLLEIEDGNIEVASTQGEGTECTVYLYRLAGEVCG